MTISRRWWCSSDVVVVMMLLVVLTPSLISSQHSRKHSRNNNWAPQVHYERSGQMDGSCDCNGYSDRCYFDQQLYEKTGHGGHCLDCTANRDGPNCQRCRDHYYEIEGGMCIACNCDDQGSRSLQCGTDGKCLCKSGVTGDKCDRCQDDFFDFSSQGCKACGCSKSGSYGNEPQCDPVTGVCSCKRNVEGQQCDTCKPSFFSLNTDNEFGCTPCFCYGHSSICQSAGRYTKGVVESGFVRGVERWKAKEWTGRSVPVSYNAAARILEVTNRGQEKIYFLAPDRFLGDQRASYNQELKFLLRIGGPQAQATTEDIVLEGSGLVVQAPIFAQNNPLPTDTPQEYSFRLHEDHNFGWSPRLSSRDFIALLSNLTALKIRGTYYYDGKGYLDDVRLDTARRGVFGVAANWVEMCTCPEGYIGQYCESCAAGYRHDPPSGGPFSQCVKCNCHEHAEDCDSTTGRCVCQHNTDGDQCERCAKGYYGNALVGKPDDCTPCDCPNGGPCIKLHDSTVICLECPSGYAGPRCDICTDGYFGDPKGRKKSTMPCEKCDCSGNIDPNAVANCNRTTGFCLKCIYNTGGKLCDKCLPGFYGDAMAPNKGDCRPCRCHHYGTVPEPYGPPVCNQLSGQCACKEHVTGRGCDQCQEGFWNLPSGIGCEDCACDRVGSLDSTCDTNTGQCHCRTGVTSQKCDVCEPQHFGFSRDGCQPCECDPIGSVSLQCDATGQCHCKDNVEGRTCSRCRENTYDKQAGCRDCPPCYTLIVDAVSIHRERLAELERKLADIVGNPTVINDVDFERALNRITQRVKDLYEDAKNAVTAAGGDSVKSNLNDLLKRIEKVRNLVDGVRDALQQGGQQATFGQEYITTAEEVIKRAKDLLTHSQVNLNIEGNKAYNLAANRSKEYGDQSARMTRLSVEARQEADNQEKMATQIESIAYDAHNTSSEAFTLVRQAFDDQNNISAAIKTLTDNMDDLTKLHNSTMRRARESLHKATLVMKESLALSTEATSLTIPAIDVPDLKEKAKRIEEKAVRIKAELDALVFEKQQLLEDITAQIEDAKGLLEQGMKQQQKSEELKADAFANKKSAQDAVKKADKILEDAQNTLTILRDFDDQVRDSKVAAGLAMGRIGEIEDLIASAEQQTRDARDALRGAAEDAASAERIAKEAQRTAEEASMEAEEVRREATATRDKATALKNKADQLSGAVTDAEQKLKLYEYRANEDRKLVTEAQTQANIAKSRAEAASDQVMKANEMVLEILSLLDQTPDLDPAMLDSLEQRLDAATNAYTMSGIDSSVSQLSDARTWQQEQINSYFEDIRLLRLEVRNIEEIKISLPNGCYRQTKLEP